MDAKVAIERISELEDRIRELTQERNNYASAIVNYEAFLKRIPRSLPGALYPDAMSPSEWLEWATLELGYENSE